LSGKVGTTLNTISTIGAFVLGASMLPFVWNVFKSFRHGEVEYRHRCAGHRRTIVGNPR
jgi:heme/copper-type cytochrome/quinol oxidase subunit 1